MHTHMKVWDGASLESLLTMQRIGDSTWRTALIDMNLNGRAYGGQTLGQAMASACGAAPADRHVTAMQLMFLAGVYLIPWVPVAIVAWRLPDEDQVPANGHAPAA